MSEVACALIRIVCRVSACTYSFIVCVCVCVHEVYTYLGGMLFVLLCDLSDFTVVLKVI